LFGRAKSAEPVEQRPSAVDRARILGGGLVQVVVSRLSPLTWHGFLNDKPLDPSRVRGLYIGVEAPTTDQPDGLVTAVLTHAVPAVDGSETIQQRALFPCVIEIVAAGRRLVVAASQADAIGSVWVELGLKPDGSGHAVSGLQALRVVLEDEVFEASLTWTDGAVESLFEQVA
jgi:hypothetical protein